jgi:hypothetical protein
VNPFERVVPERPDGAEGILAVLLHPLQVVKQIEQSGDVIRVDVAHHDHPESEGLAAAQLVDPAAQDVRIDAARSAIDENSDRRRGVTLVVQQQAVAVVGLKGFDGESHLGQTA